MVLFHHWPARESPAGAGTGTVEAMSTYLFSLTVELDDAEIPAEPDGTRVSPEEAAARVMMMGPATLADLPEFLHHRMVVAAEARPLHPSIEDLQRRVAALEEKLASRD